MEAKLELIRATVRPLIVKILLPIFCALTIFLVVYSTVVDVSIGGEAMKIYWAFAWLTTGCVVWYFGDRTYFKRKGAQ